jgi:hypothetical protein
VLEDRSANEVVGRKLGVPGEQLRRQLGYCPVVLVRSAREADAERALVGRHDLAELRVGATEDLVQIERALQLFEELPEKTLFLWLEVDRVSHDRSIYRNAGCAR